MLVHLDNLFPGLPPVSIITLIGICILLVSVILYMLSRTRELLLIGSIAALYAVVPLIGMMQNMR